VGASNLGFDNNLKVPLESFGFKLSSQKLFPWKSLLSHLASHALVLKNWPVDILFPGEEHRGKGSGKGISDLTLPECSKLVAALTDTSDSKLYLEHIPNMKGMSFPFSLLMILM